LTGFIWYSLLSDWHVFSAFFILNGGVILSTRAIREEQRAGLIESALQGMVSKEMLNALKKNPEVLYRRPKNLQLTVMFIDIEGFSLRTKDSISPDVFTLLHAQMDLMTEIIHAHGGIIDRILGDGLMCYFGFSPIEDEKIVSPSEHAYRALKCAIAIQREAARVTATANLAHGTLAAVVPLRIGINSGEVFLGNLGAGRRIDFTVVGNTVTKAKRLEDACETFKILMGSETYRSLQQCAEFVSGEMPEVIARLYSLKHQNEHETGWEFDPFSSHPELYETAKEVVRRASGMQSEFRTIEPASTVRLKINDKISGQLISLGSEHMRISSQEYFCKKVHLTIEFCPDSQEMSERLFHLGMTTLYVHVISGAPAPDGSFHHDVKTHPFESSEYSELKTLLSGQY
jgi:class 3 adenylate cyclase